MKKKIVVPYARDIHYEFHLTKLKSEYCYFGGILAPIFSQIYQ